MSDFTGKDPTYFWRFWHLVSEKGRQYWKFELPAELTGIIQTESDWEQPEGQAFLRAMDEAFVFNTEKNPNSADRILRFQLEQRAPAGKLLPRDNSLAIQDQVKHALFNGFSYYERLQQPDGNWGGDYAGPLFLTPGLVIASYITGTPFEQPLQVLLKRYLWNHQNEDGGWGLHIEDTSTMFGTVMQYVTLRILGETLENPGLKAAQKWILKNGGAVQIPQWGKFYLSLLNVYDWAGNDPLLPELWILPKRLPIHPGKYWCHNRMILLPMSYCYGERIQAEITPLILELRKELYTTEYETIDWKKARMQACPVDIFNPVNKWYLFLRRFLNGYEKINPRKLRKKSLAYVSEYVDHEDEYTRFIDIGPVNQAINSICAWYQYGKESEQFQNHVRRWHDYLWVAEDGAKMNGYNGSQLWDTAFAGQALIEGGMEEKFPEMATRIYNYVESTQIERNAVNRERYWQDLTLGCWPFSTIDHGWAITDCTSEGVKTTLFYNSLPGISKLKEIGEDRLRPAIDWLLSMQNKDGGWASYELSRAPKWIEVLNPTLLFENIMTEVTYTECTSATIQALVAFSKRFSYRNKEVLEAVSKGAEFIKTQQRKDGSWYGHWAVCFTYGIWFGVEGLMIAGVGGYEQENPDQPICKACEFLLSKQRSDGSWGESFQSCVQHEYVEHSEGQIVNTAWALLTLMRAHHPDTEAIKRGTRFLLSRQKENGDFPQEGISGIFNGNCAITYTAYRNVFPLWALGRFLRIYGNQ